MFFSQIFRFYVVYANANFSESLREIDMTTEACSGSYLSVVQVKIVRDTWTEEDDFGKVRFATVQVSQHFLIMEISNNWCADLWRHNPHLRRESRIPRSLSSWLQGDQCLRHPAPPCCQAPYYKDLLSPTLPPSGVYFVDHVVGNQPDLTMEDAAKWWKLERK